MCSRSRVPASRVSIQPRPASIATGSAVRSGQPAASKAVRAGSKSPSGQFALKKRSPSEVGTRRTVDHGTR